jgi:hypothetical protein
LRQPASGPDSERSSRLEAGADELAKLRTRLSQTLEATQTELAHSRAALQRSEMEMHRAVAEKAALERQVGAEGARTTRGCCGVEWHGRRDSPVFTCSPVVERVIVLSRVRA